MRAGRANSAAARLRTVLSRRFNLDELEALAAEAGATWDELRGQTALGKANALVDWATRNDRLLALTVLVVRSRPDNLEDWLFNSFA